MKGAKANSESKKPDRLAVKKREAPAAKKAPAKKAKEAKDPNKPKRPASAFFVFMEDFRKQYKEKHPNNKSVSVVGKAGGDKWKSLSAAEKAPFVAKAEKRKAEYDKTLQAYNKKLTEKKDEKADVEEDEEEESDKKSEVHDDEAEDDDDDSGDDDEDDDE
nr:HMG1/2-like protein [Tanacetum cinerariifolium]